MISFKQFISEEAVGKKPQFTPLDANAAIEVLNQECRASLWMLYDNKPFYRGMDYPRKIDKLGFGTVDTSATERKSQNTTNYYTMILDNNPYCKDFPKRSRSFISSTSIEKARGYAWGLPVVLIPADSAKVGIVGKNDIWDTQINLGGYRGDLEDLNRAFKSYLGLAPTLDSFEKFAERAKDRDSAEFHKLTEFCPGESNARRLAKDFMDELFKAYSPAKTGFTTYPAANLPHKLPRDSEVWVSGKVVIITMPMWEKLRKHIKNGGHE